MRLPSFGRTPGRSSFFTLLFASGFCLGDPESQDVERPQTRQACRWTSCLSLHELRTPLAVICASAQNIADGVVEEKEQLASTAPSSEPNSPASPNW